MPLLGGCEEFLLKGLQVAQNKAARFVTNCEPYTSTETMLKECGWLSVSQLVFFHSVLLLFKVRKCQKPKYLFEMAVPAENQRYGTRRNQVGKLKVTGRRVPVQLLNLNSFRWRSVKYWNQLPWPIRQVNDSEI